jgi:hypothetical protein
MAALKLAADRAVRTFAEVTGQLDGTLVEVTAAKADVEATTKAATVAKERLETAVATTRALQLELQLKVDGVIGEPSSDRVRVS